MTAEGDVREIGIIGLDERHRGRLERIGRDHGFGVRRLLGSEQVRHVASFDLDALLDEARERLRQYRVAGIATYWDFPSSCLVAILTAEQDLPGPRLRAVTTFEHKYWSRLLQQKVAPADTPRFASVDVLATPEAGEPPLPYPFWFKPVKSFSGHLGFRVTSDADYQAAFAAIRCGVHRLGAPFQQVLDRLDDLPEEIAALGGAAAIAEGILDGEQCTLEGHVHAGEVRIHGVFDIHRDTDGSTFTHYTYPSRLSSAACDRMRRLATDLIAGAGFDDGTFNIEFFIDDERGRAWILEVNPRISQEHHHLMDWVDGATNLEVMARTALGDELRLEPRGGSCALAAKFFVRRRDDGVVTGVPDPDRIAAIERRYSPCAVEVLVAPGDRLSERPDQEPYSYLVAYVYLGADDEEHLREHYDAVITDLDLRFGDP